RRRAGRAVLFRQGSAAPHACRVRAAGRPGKGPGVLRPLPPSTARARAPQSRPARDAGARLDHAGAVRGRARHGARGDSQAGDGRYQGYNRAIDAARPVGSLLKPAIYLTALSEPSRYTLLTPIDDGPFVWKSRGAPDWEPANYDRKFHGAVPLRVALAQSYNV